jgi:hypothetical protein
VHLEGGRNRKHRGGRQAGAPGPLPHADSGQLIVTGFLKFFRGGRAEQANAYEVG